MKKFKFKNGDTIDAIGLGTWKSDPGEVGKAVKAALDVGYRHIDCAAVYGNEAEVGEALQESFSKGELNREDVWVTSKLWNTEHKREDVIPALKQTLKDLKLDELDLYLIHWPLAFRPGLQGIPEKDEDFLSPEEAPLSETWHAMAEAKKEGLVRHIGVSNFSINKLEKLINETGEVPEMNQVELHPYLQQNDLLSYCKEKHIFITAYSPLGSMDRPDSIKAENEPSLLENEIITGIAVKHNATPAQILIKWAVERDTIVIPKSTNPGRIEENINSMNISLDEDDHAQIKQMDRHYRYLNGKMFETESPMYQNIFDD